MIFNFFGIYASVDVAKKNYTTVKKPRDVLTDMEKSYAVAVGEIPVNEKVQGWDGFFLPASNLIFKRSNLVTVLVEMSG